MLRALIWSELCATWWWWLLVLLPFAISRQFTVLASSEMRLLWLMPVMVGLGLASGQRDRRGVRDALIRHGDPWRVLIAKLTVPGLLMPAYYLLGGVIASAVSDRRVDLGSFREVSLSASPLLLAPLFLAGVAAGLRQARWWGTRFAPLAALATLMVLAEGLLPWEILWYNATTFEESTRSTVQLIAVVIAAICVLLAWWCLAALREAGGEDGPGSRAAAAVSITLALIGVAMVPWLYLSERWEGMLAYQPHPASPTHPAFAEPVLPAWSLARLVAAEPSFWHARTDDGYIGGVALAGRIGDGQIALSKVLAAAPGTPENPAVILRTESGDEPTFLADAWRRLHLTVGQHVLQQWRQLRFASWGAGGGRFVQGSQSAADQRNQRGLNLWHLRDDPGWVEPMTGSAAHARLYQLDDWTGPQPILRLLTAADPPLLCIRDQLRIGIWEDRLDWNDGPAATVAIPHPFAAGTAGAIEIGTGDATSQVIWHWRDSPWSILRWEIAIVARDGRVLTRRELPTAEGDPAFLGLGLLGSPAIAAIGLERNRANGSEVTYRAWASPRVLPWTLVGALLAAAGTWGILAHRGVAMRARWPWLITALLGGIAVPLAALAVWLPAARRACPACGQRRWADDRICPACHSGWDAPAGDARDIRDEVAAPLVAAAH